MSSSSSTTTRQRTGGAPISTEQLQLLQLCFGEHEFGTSDDIVQLQLNSNNNNNNNNNNGQDDGDEESIGVEGGVERRDKDTSAEGTKNLLEEERGGGGTVLDFDAMLFIHDKMDHGIGLDTITRDLETFEQFLQARIMQHVHENVYDAFVAVSGELVGVDEQLSRVQQPLLSMQSRVSHAVTQLSNKEDSIQKRIQEAEAFELQRLFHVNMTQGLLLYHNLCDAVDGLMAMPYFSGLSRSSSGQHTAGAGSTTTAVYPNDLPSDDDLAELEEAISTLFDLKGTLHRCSMPTAATTTATAGGGAALFSEEDKSEYALLESLVGEAHQHVAGILQKTFLHIHHVYAQGCHSALPPQTRHHHHASSQSCKGSPAALLRRALKMFSVVGIQDFVQMYRDQVVRVLAEDVLSWRASAQARTSPEQSAHLLQELCTVLETVILPIATMMRDVFSEHTTTSSSSATTVLPIPHAIWPAVCTTVVTRMVFLFLPGIASAFHSHFIAAHRLVSLMELHCASVAELQAFRSSTETTLWSHKWNVEVYHTLRATEANERMVAVLEEMETKGMLTAATTDAAASSPMPFRLKATASVASIVMWLFQPDVYLYPVTHKLLRDAVSFMHTFIQSATTMGIRALESAGSSSQGGGSTSDWALIGSLLYDFDQLSKFVADPFRQLVESSSGEVCSACQPLNNVITLGRNMPLQYGVQRIRETIVQTLVAQCNAVLQNVRTVKATYSHTKKPMPTSPSWFVSGILESVTKFRSAALQHSAMMQADAVQELVRQVAEIVTTKLREYTKETIISARKTEESLGKLRRKREEAAKTHTSAAAAGGAEAMMMSTPTTATAATPTTSATTRVTNETATDRDKMVVQLYLDVHEFGNQLRPLGINKESFPLLQSVLHLCRRANWILGDAIAEPTEVEDDE